MKDYQNLIGYLIIAIAIVVAGAIIAYSIRNGFNMLGDSIAYMADLLR